MKVLSFLFLGFLVAAPSSFACDEIDISLQQTGASEYQPTAIQPLLTEVTLTVNRVSGDGCANEPISIVARNGEFYTLRYNAETLLGDRPANSNVLPIGDRYALTGADKTELFNSRRLQLPMVELRPGQFVEPGDYRVDFDILVRDRIIDREQLTIRVPAAVRLVGESARGSKTLSFGELTSGTSVSSTFFFQTNANVSVTATSLNDGALVHERGSEFGSVPYTTHVMGRAINSDGSQAVNMSAQNRGMTQTGNMRVTVGETGPLFAGKYSDVLTLSFTAN